MQKTIVYIAMSLDGFIAGPSDDISFLNSFGDVDYGYKEFFASIGAIIQGKRTYDVEVKNGWEYAHEVPLFVLTRNPAGVTSARPDVTFTDEPIDVVLARAKAGTTKNIWIEGGARVVQDYFKQGLVDELVIAIIPVLLGDGVSLFDHLGKQIVLTHQETQTFAKGLVMLTYTL